MVSALQPWIYIYILVNLQKLRVQILVACRNVVPTRLPFSVSTAPSFSLIEMHPRTQYLADAGKNRDPALQPLLQGNSSRTDQEAAAEPPASHEKASAAPSAPLLSTATSSATPSADHTTPSAYGLPSGYRAQYAGAVSILCSSRPILSCLTSI